MQTISNKNSTPPSHGGKRLTRQRSLILEIIQKKHGHLDARDIHHEAQKKLPRISLSTVYRNLRLFKSSSVVEELCWGNHRHYETKARREHYHIICLGCGHITEFKYPFVRELKAIPQVQEFELHDIEINLYGYCPNCQKER